MPKAKRISANFLLCLSNAEPDLQKGKLYKVVPDESAGRNNYVRVIDDSGEEYLSPADFFTVIELSGRT